jgi:hypothetical protein
LGPESLPLTQTYILSILAHTPKAASHVCTFICTAWSHLPLCGLQDRSYLGNFFLPGQSITNY